MDDNATQTAALTEGALVRALPDLATLEVTGDDRHSWLSGMVTADLASSKPGNGVYALSVNKNGRLQAELWIILQEDSILIGVQRDLLEPLVEHMETYLIMEDVEIAPPEQARAWWLAHGPKAEVVAELARTEAGVVGLGTLGDIKTAVIAMPKPLPAQGEALVAAEGVLLATPDGWDKLRIERLLPRFGVDFQLGSYPQEACLEKLAVSFNKGCYIGQEAVFMLEKRGHVSKRLVRLVTDEPLEVGAKICTAAGDEVGTVTSATSLSGQGYAIGMVRYKYIAGGTELRVGERAALVSDVVRNEVA